MKILRIRFSNINSLKGEHEIDFTTSPLEHAGIFAITGPTGSGKSTILDVITLALFSRIPRFSSKITKNEIEGQGSVITRNTNEAYASVEYLVKQKHYRSIWNVARTKTGNLKDYHMEITDLDTGKVLDLKKSAVPEQNEKIIGLEYDQFIKSIILSQGEFARFLKADKNQRGELLENITGSSIYRKIGIAAFQKHKEVKQSFIQMKERIGDFQLLEPEQLKEIDSLSKQAIERINSLEKEIKTAASLIQIKKEIDGLQKEIKEKGHAILQLKKDKEAFKVEEQKLMNHEKVNPFRGRIALFNDANNSLVKANREILSNQQNEIKAKEQLTVAIDKMALLTKTEISKENFMDQMSAFEKSVHKMDAELEKIKEKGADLRKRINEDLEESQSDFAPSLLALRQADKAQAQLEDYIKQSKAKLKELGGSTEENSTDLANRIAQIEKSLELNRSLKTHFENLEKNKELVLAISNATTKFESELKMLSPQMQQDKAQLEALEQLQKDLQKNKEQAIKLLGLNELRLELVKGDPCPLCGSKEHPLSGHTEKEPKGIDLELSKVKERLEAATKSLEDKKAKQIVLQTNIEQNKKRIAECRQIENDNKSAIAKLSDGSNEYKEAKAIIAQIEKSEALILGLSKAQSLKTELDFLQSINKEYIQLVAVTKEYKLLHTKRNEKFGEEDVSKSCNKIQNDFQSAQQDLLRYSTLIKQHSDEKLQLESTLKAHTAELLPTANRIGFSSIAEMAGLILDDKNYAAIKARKEALNTQETALNSSQADLNLRLAKALELDITKEKNIEALEIAQDQKQSLYKTMMQQQADLQAQINQDKKNRDQLKSIQTDLKDLEESLNKWTLLKQLIGDANGNTFANFAQGLTLQNLLVMANKRLLDLTDRYLLVPPEDQGDLMIMDQYQGNTKRAVSTLSGGESFIISLALAFSLSDMASRNVALDSLFIDEGFGTLDKDTLDVAMNTLDKIQSESQKTVGIISHVDALKERISVQIQLKKNAQGFSSIELVE